jgi:hypothetical protein
MQDSSVYKFVVQKIKKLFNNDKTNNAAKKQTKTKATESLTIKKLAAVVGISALLFLTSPSQKTKAQEFPTNTWPGSGIETIEIDSENIGLTIQNFLIDNKMIRKNQTLTIDERLEYLPLFIQNQLGLTTKNPGTYYIDKRNTVHIYNADGTKRVRIGQHEGRLERPHIHIEFAPENPGDLVRNYRYFFYSVNDDSPVKKIINYHIELSQAVKDNDYRRQKDIISRLLFVAKTKALKERSMTAQLFIEQLRSKASKQTSETLVSNFVKTDLNFFAIRIFGYETINTFIEQGLVKKTEGSHDEFMIDYLSN